MYTKIATLTAMSAKHTQTIVYVPAGITGVANPGGGGGPPGGGGVAILSFFGGIVSRRRNLSIIWAFPSDFGACLKSRPGQRFG